MPTNTCIPYFDEADNLTATATAAVTGKTFVVVSASVQADLTLSAAPSGANARCFGVAEYDAAIGQWFGVIREGVVPVTCGAVALAAGVEVMSDANGDAVVWDGVLGHRPNGMCLSAAQPGADAMIALY